MKTTEKVIIRRTAIIDRNREYTFNYLNEHPCVDCGESRILALDFDHVRGLKEYDICEMVRYGMSLKRIKNEVSKCQLPTAKAVGLLLDNASSAAISLLTKALAAIFLAAFRSASI